MRTYEAMFLLDPTRASQEWDNLKQHIIGMIEKRGGSILYEKKWAERKLAYEIKKHKRGTYYLVYFEIDPKAIVVLRRDLQLSEQVLRHLIIAHEKGVEIPSEESENQKEETGESEEETTPSNKEEQEASAE